MRLRWAGNEVGYEAKSMSTCTIPMTYRHSKKVCPLKVVVKQAPELSISVSEILKRHECSIQLLTPRIVDDIIRYHMYGGIQSHCQRPYGIIG